MFRLPNIGKLMLVNGQPKRFIWGTLFNPYVNQTKLLKIITNIPKNKSIGKESSVYVLNINWIPSSVL